MPENSNPTRNLIAMLAFSGIFLLMGAWIILVALEVIPVPPESVHAPMWVIGFVGLSFFLSGLVVILNGLREMGLGEHTLFGALHGLLVALLALGLLIPFHWVAFGSGERQFSSSVSIPYLDVAGSGSELGGRLAFGCFALLADIVILSIVVRAVWRLWLAPSRDG